VTIDSSPCSVVRQDSWREIWRGSIHGTYFCDLVASKTNFHKHQIFTYMCCCIFL